jgi:hypothetical protein
VDTHQENERPTTAAHLQTSVSKHQDAFYYEDSPNDRHVEEQNTGKQYQSHGGAQRDALEEIRFQDKNFKQALAKPGLEHGKEGGKKKGGNASTKQHEGKGGKGSHAVLPVKGRGSVTTTGAAVAPVKQRKGSTVVADNHSKPTVVHVEKSPKKVRNEGSGSVASTQQHTQSGQGEVAPATDSVAFFVMTIKNLNAMIETMKIRDEMNREKIDYLTKQNESAQETIKDLQLKLSSAYEQPERHNTEFTSSRGSNELDPKLSKRRLLLSVSDTGVRSAGRETELQDNFAD